MPTAKLRHVAINVFDIDKSAKFYAAAFGMKELARLGSEESGACYMTDGTVNLALIKISDPDHVNFLPRGGLSHIGFVVDDLDGIISQAQGAGAKCTVDADDPLAGPTWEMKMMTPDGVAIDLSPHGWPGVTL
jgi:catechol 2,3-dioxygenase-like lactoylglutathione lyase family enzyme